MWHKVREVDDGFVIRCCGRDLLLLSPQREGRPQGRTLDCKLCYAGLKAVIFITGVCDENCYYCPVDRDRFGRSVMYVNDERAHSLDDIVREGDRARVVVSYPTQSREPVVCEAESEDPGEALRGCVT